MPKPEPDEPDLTFSAPDVAAEIVRWLGYLGAEKRMSPKTVEAYQRDVHQFLAFLAEQLDVEALGRHAGRADGHELGAGAGAGGVFAAMVCRAGTGSPAGPGLKWPAKDTAANLVTQGWPP